MKFCKDCRFSEERKGSDSEPAVVHACTAVCDIVTGEPTSLSCRDARFSVWCGIDAKLFKERLADGQA